MNREFTVIFACLHYIVLNLTETDFTFVFPDLASHPDMILDNLVIWYQKKIGAYDRQEWEKTVEDRILEGFTSLTLKNARVKTEFIDIDLVRGKQNTVLSIFSFGLARSLLFSFLIGSGFLWFQ